MKKYAIISMDVEDWYHSHFPGEDVEKSVSLLDGLSEALRIMDRESIKGSFFVVGEIAENLKDTLKDMDREGHDIGAHGWDHVRPLAMTTAGFKEQLQYTKEAVEGAIGHEVTGYRAPCFAINDNYLDIVKELGFKYDSSKLKPQKSEKYGDLFLKGYDEIYPCVYRKNDFTEFEVSSQKIGSFNMLLGGGELGHGLLKLFVGEIHLLGDLPHPLIDLRLLDLLHLQAEGDVVIDRHGGEERVALEHDADVAVLDGHVGDVPSLDEHAAGDGLDEARDGPERRRLAAAGRSQKSEEFALLHMDVDVMQGGEVAEFYDDVVEFDHVLLPSFCQRLP